MTSNTLGQRMRAAAESAGLTQREVGVEVARRIGRKYQNGQDRPFTEAAVGQWYSDESEPTLPALREFSKHTNVDLMWLMTGIGGKAGPLPREGHLVPRISLAQAIKSPIDYASNESIHTFYPCSERSFVITVADTRNEPRYGVGHKLVFDPELHRPRPGQMVLAVVGGEPIIGQYTERTEKGSKTIVIVPMNAAWSEDTLNLKKGDRIVATMTESASQAP